MGIEFTREEEEYSRGSGSSCASLRLVLNNSCRPVASIEATEAVASVKLFPCG